MITRNQKANRHKFCSEPLELVENYQQALAEGFKGWCMHHRLEIQPDGTRMSRQELKDKGLYYGRPASELIFMRGPEHSYLHNKGRTFSEESRQKMSEAKRGENNPNFGKQLSEEHRQKIAEAHKGENNPFFGKHHSAETRQKMSKTRKAMLWWNNGILSTRSRECPGEGWKRGRLRFK